MHDTRTHLDVGYEPTFSIGLLVPTLFRTGIVTVATREALQPELLMQGVQSNTGWMEHRETVCKDCAPRTSVPLSTHISIVCVLLE